MCPNCLCQVSKLIAYCLYWTKISVIYFVHINCVYFVIVIIISFSDINTKALFSSLKNTSIPFVLSYDTEIRLDFKLEAYRMLSMETLLVYLLTLVSNSIFFFPMISNVKFFSTDIPKYSLLKVV